MLKIGADNRSTPNPGMFILLYYALYNKIQYNDNCFSAENKNTIIYKIKIIYKIIVFLFCYKGQYTEFRFALRKILQSTAFFYSRLIFPTCPSSTTRTS